MNIKIVCAGKLEEKYFKDGTTEYVERMEHFAKVKVIQIPDGKTPERLNPAEMGQVKKIEGKRILDKIEDREYVYVTAVKGKERTSEDFARELADLTTYGHSNITSVIGGSLGTSNTVNKRADDLVGLGRFTMPCQLMWLVLIEQIYRAFMINSGSPYHK